MAITKEQVVAWRDAFTRCEVGPLDTESAVFLRYALMELISYYEEIERRKAFDAEQWQKADKAMRETPLIYEASEEPSTPAERRRYALLQAAAVLLADGRGNSVDAVDAAFMLLSQIEKREKAKESK